MNEEGPNKNVVNFQAEKAKRVAEKAAETLKSDPTLRLPVPETLSPHEEYERNTKYRGLAAKLLGELKDTGSMTRSGLDSYQVPVDLMSKEELAAALDVYVNHPTHFRRSTPDSKALVLATRALFVFGS